MVVEINEDDYKRGLENLKFNILGRLSLLQGDSVPTTMEVKSKLVEGLQIDNMKVIAMGRGVFHVILSNIEDQSHALASGSLFLRPGNMRFSIWFLGFNTMKSIQTMS